MTSPHPPERASATLRAICLHSVVRGRATGRCVSSFRNPLFAWSGSRSRIHFSVGCASLTRSNGLRTAFERHSRLARAVRIDTREAFMQRQFEAFSSSPTPTEQQQKDTGQ